MKILTIEERGFELLNKLSWRYSQAYNLSFYVHDILKNGKQENDDELLVELLDKLVKSLSLSTQEFEELSAVVQTASNYW